MQLRIRLFGEMKCPEAYRIRDFLQRNGMRFQWTNIWDAGRNRTAEFGGETSGNPINAKAISFGMSAERVGQHVVKCVEKEEFYIFTHPHVRDIAEQRWQEIAAAMDRQWPDGAGEDQLNTLDVQKKLIESLQAAAH